LRVRARLAQPVEIEPAATADPRLQRRTRLLPEQARAGHAHDRGPGERPWTDRGQLVAVRMGKGTGWVWPAAPQGPKTRKAAKVRPWIGRGNSPLLSQKVANPPASARRDGQRGASGLRRLLSRSLNAKNPPEASGRHTPLFCIYDPILQLVDGNVKHQVASERISRRTRVLRKNPGSGAVKSRPARDSLIRWKNSLMARINSLQGRIKFPVPMRRDWVVNH
jgi:hypothetical protein